MTTFTQQPPALDLEALHRAHCLICLTEDTPQDQPTPEPESAAHFTAELYRQLGLARYLDVAAPSRSGLRALVSGDGAHRPAVAR